MHTSSPGSPVFNILDDYDSYKDYENDYDSYKDYDNDYDSYKDYDNDNDSWKDHDDDYKWSLRGLWWSLW